MNYGFGRLVHFLRFIVKFRIASALGAKHIAKQNNNNKTSTSKWKKNTRALAQRIEIAGR